MRCLFFVETLVSSLAGVKTLHSQTSQATSPALTSELNGAEAFL